MHTHHLSPTSSIRAIGLTMSTLRIDIEKFDGDINFVLWQVKMVAVLTRNGPKKELFEKGKKLAMMSEDKWNENGWRGTSINAHINEFVSIINDLKKKYISENWRGR